MNRYALAWTAAAGFLIAADLAAGARPDGASFLVDNTVCLNLVTLILFVLLPSRDITDVLLSYMPGANEERSN